VVKQGKKSIDNGFEPKNREKEKKRKKRKKKFLFVFFFFSLTDIKKLIKLQNSPAAAPKT